ncbi:bifunctional helix-turn-helix domain-containing protein/methylated-DNA--[protein]-cysteine S-methyltransferase [Photobacterium sanguinicancri]|uniref:bifunctional helix-turn-helix domain-containing protein/methylated-DNA--[protein]-cysteine S-methyltransferase n=1 Tax=Photobacterium sanguinicancri TaxID=875932 RepID=UPI0021C3A22F|nr:methylated-DNA--[protein]-cysteine S-methyltransferase [Photobacterium sanguinicancri]
MSNSEIHRHYHVVEQAINFIHRNFERQPTLAEIAQSVYMSEHHLQRVFSEWAGISPKRFLQVVTKQAALDALKQTRNLMEASQSVGLSGTSRLHDLMVTCEAMTPGEIKKGGEGVSIQYGVAVTPFDEAVIAWTDRGICFLQFTDHHAKTVIDELYQQWPNGTFEVNSEQAQEYSDTIFSVEPDKKLARGKIHLVLKGTNFQVKVWEAMINTHSGQQLSYSQVAQLMGSPKASRAVGTALANNTIGYLIPCHRVIKSNGELGNYRWRPDRKAAILAWENATQNE